MFESWTPGDVIALVLACGVVFALCLPIYQTVLTTLHGFVYAVQDRWLDRTRNRIEDSVISSKDED